MAPFKYRAFISYSHADRRWAEWLHKALETYRVPSRLVGRETAAGPVPRTLAPIFRDRDELATSHSLTGKVEEALAQSANLIVICSPHAAQSKWVEAEISAFQKLGHGDRVFCLIVDGDPHECFASVLRDADGEEPIAADARSSGDGKTNAKLKLIAGVLDVGFDELRRREAQRAHRRMAIIAGLAVVGMLVTSSLAVVAVRERNEAQFQRTQAEQLIGFMLGNLRDKLEQVSRLDILDDVADHTMGYFAAQQRSGGASAERQRANALLLVGRIRLDQGRFDEAERAFHASLNVAEALVAAAPDDPALQVARSDALGWLGMVAWNRGDPEKALVPFRAALPGYVAAVRAQPHNAEWLTHESWAHNNLGHILEAKGALREARIEYEANLALCRRVAAMKPHDDTELKRVAIALDNLGQLFYAQGDLAASERAYREERAMQQAIVARDPKNASVQGDLSETEVFYARVAAALGNDAAARESLETARRLGEPLLESDPGNAEAAGDVASYYRRLGRLARLDGDLAAAAPLLARAQALYTKMLALSPDSSRGRVGLGITVLEQARLAWKGGDAAVADVHARDAAGRFAAQLREHGDDRGASLAMANAQLLLGNLADARGQADAARVAWSRGLSALSVFGADSNDPDQLATQAQLLHALGRIDQAQPILARLDAMGYRDAEFMAWAGAHGTGRGTVAAADPAQ